MKDRMTALTLAMVVFGWAAGAAFAALETTWFRLEDGTGGSDVGAMLNSGSSSATGAGYDFHAAPDETQPKYNAYPDPVAYQVQAGEGGAVYANSLHSCTAGTTADTGNLHGGGVLDVQGFYLNGWHSQTIEFFYRTPGGADWAAAKAKEERILMLGPSSYGDASSYLVEIRLLSDGRLYAQHSGNDGGMTGALNLQPLEPDTWYHLAYVAIESGGDGNFPTATFKDKNGNDVSYATQNAYFFLDGILGASGEHDSASNGGVRMWLGSFPPHQANWDIPTGGRLDTTTIGCFDEVRLTHNGGGTHFDAAALHPDQFLRFLPEFDAVELTDVIALSFFALNGVTYGLDIAEDPGGTNWAPSGVSLAGDDSMMSLFDPTGYSTQKLYRIVTQ